LTRKLDVMRKIEVIRFDSRKKDRIENIFCHLKQNCSGAHWAPEVKEKKEWLFVSNKKSLKQKVRGGYHHEKRNRNAKNANENGHDDRENGHDDRDEKNA